VAPTVRVGIVSWNTGELLDRCLQALPSALRGTKAEIVVVDNASVDRSVVVARSHPAVEVISNEANEGYAKAINQALSARRDGPRPDVLIALNPDTVAPPGSLTTLVERLLADPSVGLVAPRLLNADGTTQHSVYRFPSAKLTALASLVPLRWQSKLVGRGWWLEGASTFDRRCDIDWAIGAVHVIRAEAVESFRPYRENWFMYVEDLDLCWRMAQNGWRRVLEGDVGVTHIGNAAGAQAWGEARTEKWLQATYDWYRSVHGKRAVRRWAAVSALGIAFRMVGRKWRRMRGIPEQPWEKTLDFALPMHLAVLRTGTPNAGTGESPQGFLRPLRSQGHRS
jgi:GT2 family glycosyltransferase